MKIGNRIAVFLLLALVGTMSPDPCRGETLIIPMKFRTAAEALPIVRDLLSPQGKATMDVRTNSLILTGDRKGIEKIRGFLARYDVPVREANIRLRFRETGSREGRSVSAGGRVSGRDWSIGKGGGRKEGIDLRLQQRREEKTGDSEYFIRVLSGSWAYILVGRDILFRERWIELYRRHARIREGLTVQRIETGMEVRPVLVGDRANVEILPRISHEVPGGKERIIRFAEASTRVSVPVGQWVGIGGTDQERNEVIRAILESGRREGGSSLSISLMVESTPERD
jgi:type II secretory pathway component GspD/PulD (secretin)